MNKTVLSTAVTAAALALGAAAPGVVQAQGAAPEASPLTFNAGIFSEYRYRGIAQSRFQPAVQVGADYAFPSGFYIGTWASTIKWIKDAKGGAVEFRVEKAGIVHGGIGKASFTQDALEANVKAFVDALTRAKPSGAKGTYVKRISLSSTMGPGVKVDPASLNA